MIHDVDASLRALLESEVLDNGDVDVAFDAPTKDWASRRNAPTLNAFLYDIREDLARREVAPRAVRNAAGIVVDRQKPLRRFKLSYLLTAWTQRAEDEHRLLSQMLAAFLRFDAVPDAYLSGSLEGAAVPVLLRLAMPPTADRSLSDVWTALGGEMRPSLDLQVIAPFDSAVSFETGPPVREATDLRMARVGDPA